MPVISPYQIALTAGEEAVLAARARSARSPYRDRLRARIVLAAAAGSTNVAIAAQVGVHVDTVRKWRRRFAAARLAGLKDAPRSGRPPVFTAADRAEAVALSRSCSHAGQRSATCQPRTNPYLPVFLVYALQRTPNLRCLPRSGQQWPKGAELPVLAIA
jgi:transposase-like protein